MINRRPSADYPERPHSPIWQTSLTMKRLISISCLAQGNPTIAKGQATFDGSSYYQCDVPEYPGGSLRSCGNLPSLRLAPANVPYVQGQGSIEGNPIDPNPENPVFYRDDILFGIPLDVSTQKSRSKGEVWSSCRHERADLLSIRQVTEITSPINPTSPTVLSPVFVVDGNSLSATPATINQPHCAF